MVSTTRNTMEYVGKGSVALIVGSVVFLMHQYTSVFFTGLVVLAYFFFLFAGIRGYPGPPGPPGLSCKNCVLTTKSEDITSIFSDKSRQDKPKSLPPGLSLKVDGVTGPPGINVESVTSKTVNVLSTNKSESTTPIQD